MIKFYNFLTRKTEEFKPIAGKAVGLYTCGPTVYDFVHIGNWRTFVFEDVLKRVLEFGGYKVNHVMNITDIDDKIIKKSSEQGVELREFTQKYEKAFLTDLAKLNIIPASKYPRATEHIEDMIAMIQKLLDEGFAYKAEDGIYFSVEEFEHYGELSGLQNRDLKKGARVNDDEYDKSNWADFALWKFKREGEPGWQAPFGEGRPGWHIECSAMSTKYLGDFFDLHTGGIDLLFPHHENEIAQSEAASGLKFVNYWLEGEHLLVDSQKMSKSLGNIYTLEDIVKRGIDPLALRYLYLTAHYRSKLNFTWESLAAAQSALANLRDQIVDWDAPSIGCAEYEAKFADAISNDLDMPKALAVMWDLVKSDYPSSAKHQSILLMDKVLGLGLEKLKRPQLSDKEKELIEKRGKLREAGDFKGADLIREQLISLGTVVEDTPDGPKVKKSK